MKRAALATALALVACSKRSEPPTAGSGSAAPPPGTLQLVAQLRGLPVLVEGTRRIALRFADEAFWYETAPGKLELRADVGDRVARTIAELGGAPPDVLLGATVIVSGGEHHREKHVRVGDPPREVEVEGFVDQVAAFDSGDEIWRVEHEAQKQLVIVHADGRVAPVAPFERIGKEIETMSPVSAKICAQPATIDIASNGTHVVALVRECDPEAPYRIARFQLPGPSLTITKLGSQAALGFDARAIAIAPAGEVALVGTRGDAHAIARIDATGRVTITVGPAGVRVIGEAVMADDGAVWSTVALNGGTVLRDNVAVPLRARGEVLRAVELWHDRHFGVVVIAAAETRWLLAERALAGPEIAIPPR